MGILNFIKSALNGNKKEDEPVFDEIINAAYDEMRSKGERYWWSVKANELTSFNEKLLSLTDKQKAVFLSMAPYKINSYLKDLKSYSSEDKKYKLFNISK